MAGIEWNYTNPKKMLGKGSYSTVWDGVSKDGRPLAIKVIEYTKFKAIEQKYLDREVEIMKTLDHPNLLKMFFCDRKDGNLYLVLEKMGLELKVFIVENPNGLPEDFARAYMIQIAAGMRFMNDNGLVHRDLKPQNILLSDKSLHAAVKISDFGMARQLQAEQYTQSFLGSPEYEAPEILKRVPYSTKSDLWSLGCIFYEMLAGKSPCMSILNRLPPQQRDLGAWISKLHTRGSLSKLLERPKTCSDLCWDLIGNLLQTVPDERLSWELFFSHEYLSDASLAVSTTLFASTIDVDQPVSPVVPVVPVVPLKPEPAVATKSITLYSLRPYGQEMVLFEPTPVKLDALKEKLGKGERSIKPQHQLYLGNAGEELMNDQSLNTYLSTKQQNKCPIYLVDLAFLSGRQEFVKYEFPPLLPFIFEPLVYKDESTPLRTLDARVKNLTEREMLLQSLQERATLRLGHAKQMWRQQEFQEKVATVYSTYCSAKMTHFQKFVFTPIQNAQQCLPFLERRNDTLKKLETQSMKGTTLRNEIDPERKLEAQYDELHKLLTTIPFADLKTLTSQVERSIRQNAFSALTTISSHSADLQSAETWHRDFQNTIRKWTSMISAKAKFLKDLKDVGQVDYEALLKELPNQEHLDLEKALVTITADLDAFPLQLKAAKDKESEQVMASIEKLGRALQHLNSKTDLAQTHAARIQELAKIITAADCFAQSYTAGFLEMQRRYNFVKCLNEQVAECQSIFDQKLKAEQTKRLAFKENNSSPYLTKLFPALVADDDVPQCTIEYKFKGYQFQVPPNPLPSSGLDEVITQSENIRKEYSKIIEKDNATLNVNQKKLAERYNKTKATIPSATTQYVASLHEKIATAQTELDNITAQPKQENIKAFEKQIADQQMRNQKVKDNIERAKASNELRPKIQELEKEVEELRAKCIEKATEKESSAKVIADLLDMGIELPMAQQALLYTMNCGGNQTQAAVEWVLGATTENEPGKPLDFVELAKVLKK